MDNSDYFESLTGADEEIEASRGTAELLHRHICTRFEPYREFFLNQPIARLMTARPMFTPTISRNNRNYLHADRQLKYLRGVLQEDYCQEVMGELLKEDEYRPIKRLGNTSAILGDTFFWAENTTVKSARIWDFLKLEKEGKEQVTAGVISPNLVADLHESIHELTIVGSELHVRTPRILFILSTAGQIEGKIVLEQELICFHSKDKGRMLLSTYGQGCSQLYEHSQDRLQLWCKIDGLVHSLWAKTASEVVLCKENAIVVADRRAKVVQDLHRRAHVHKDRIYSAISLRDTVLGPRYFANTESFNICIYDMRKPFESVLKIPHYCQEAPPSVLQTYSAPTLSDLTQNNFEAFLSDSIKWREQCPLLIAHSPYPTGSSLFTELNINWETPSQLLRMKFRRDENQLANRMQLLYDPGKLQEHYHPQSVTPFPINSKVGFFHLDNFNGISLQIFERAAANHNLKGYKQQNPNNFAYQRVNFSMHQGIEGLLPPNQEWFARQTIEKQLEETTEDHWADVIGQEDEEDLELEDQPFQEKVVRFADLREFYHAVHQQAKQYPLQQKITEEETAVREKATITRKPLPTDPTLSQTQQADESILRNMKIGHLSSEAMVDLLSQWDSL